MRLKLHLYLLLISFAVCHPIYARDYYQRHYIILIDQTASSMNEDTAGLQAIGTILSNVFLNKDLMKDVDAAKINSAETYFAHLSFDPRTDEISIFKFGITGNGNQLDDLSYGLGRIRKKVRSGKNELLALTNELIVPIAQFHEKGEDIGSFIQKYMIPLFHDNGIQPGMNFSSIAFPCVLKKIDRHPAAEYYVIIVSNFKLQGSLDNRADYGTIRTAMDAQTNNTVHAQNFARQLWQLNAPFYTSELMKIQSKKGENDDSNQREHIKSIKAVCYQLGLKSLQGISSYITSNLILHETSVGATTYDLEDVNISFNKDKHLGVDSLVMRVFTAKQECLYSENVLQQSQYDETGTKSYTIPSKQLDLGRVFKVGDELTFQYLLFTSAKDDNGNDILPIVYLAERNYNVTIETLKSPEEQKRIMMVQIVFFLLGIICLALIVYYVWKQRGKSREASIEFTIWPISNDHFMEVKDKKVASYDCWYWRQGDSDKNIPISGKLNLQSKTFAKMFEYRLEAQIQDIDDNMDFSFRPDPNIKKKDGSERVANEWYEVPFDSDGTFSFSANAYIEPTLQPNFNRENVLKMKVTLRCIMKGDGDDKYITQTEHKYTFTVRPEIDNSNIWVAFDPGTTGSCVAYGASSNPTDSNDIYLAENEFDTLNDGSGKSHIYPSMIRLNHKSQNIFRNELDPTILSEGPEEDFLFGNEASMMWDEEGVNCFLSIKKLLGYTDTYTIVGQNGQEKEVEGQDVAHLLVKGLYNHVQTYVENDPNVDERLRELFVRNGTFTPQRAIVAVPNNYTMVKIQEMVDTVKRTNKFNEVHYIYEAEAVMMMYFRQCWKELPQLKNKIFVVYDMGGATINATAFKINITMGQKHGNSFIRRIEVNTISKIGYCVGGDDIDFALIQILYNIPSVKQYLFEANTEYDPMRHQQENKVGLIGLVRGLKLELIAKAHHEEVGVSHVDNAETLYGHLREELRKMNIKIGPTMTEEDAHYLNNVIDIECLKQNDFIKHYIYNNVEDAINNLFSSINESGHDIELVMSGRSVLFPGIEQLVISTIEKSGYACHRWNGFDNEKGYFSAEKVKVAVATGACWYAMYSDFIRLRNNKVTSSFGYIDMIENEQKYIPVIDRNDEFNEECFIEKSSETKSNLKDVKFVQMLGAVSDYDEILKNDIKHKYNILDEVRPAELNGSAEEVEVYVDDRGNFSYKLRVQGKAGWFDVADNRYSRLSKTTVKTEIVNENSPSYIFSTLNLIRSNHEVIKRFKKRIRQQENKQQENKPKARF